MLADYNRFALHAHLLFISEYSVRSRRIIVKYCYIGKKKKQRKIRVFQNMSLKRSFKVIIFYVFTTELTLKTDDAPHVHLLIGLIHITSPYLHGASSLFRLVASTLLIPFVVIV